MKKLIRTMLVLVLALVTITVSSCDIPFVGDIFNKEEEVFSAEDAIKVLLVEQDVYVAGDFSVPGKLNYKGNEYPLTWTSDNECLVVSGTMSENGTYTIAATRPETGKQTATLTASLTVGETTATKQFSYNLYPIDVYEISDAYSFKYAAKTVKESFALDSEFTYEGKTATITWEVPEAYASIVSISNGKVVFNEVTADTPAQIVAVFTYNEETAKRPFNFTIIPSKVGPAIVTSVADGDTFYFGLYQEGLGKYLYFAGTTKNTYYLASTDNVADSTKVTAHVVEGGYHLSFVDASGATKYLELVIGSKVNAGIVDAPSRVWTFNTEYNTFTQDVTADEAGTNAGTYYMGTYNTYDTISASKISYAATSYPTHFYVAPYGPVAAPVAGNSYKLALYQEGLGKTLYFNGNPSGYYLATTEVVTEAVDVTIVAVEGGYHLSFVDASGATKYLELTIGSKVNAGIVDTPSRVWTFNKEHYTFTQVITEAELTAAGQDTKNAGTYYIGTYNTYNTISASKISYAASSYPTRMYAEGSDLPKPVEMSISEVLASEDGTLVIVTGTVKSIDSAWDSGYGNMCVTIEDETGATLYVYRLKTLVAVGDKIVITGSKTSHNEAPQIGAGATAEILSSAGEGDGEGDDEGGNETGSLTTSFTTTDFTTLNGLVNAENTDTTDSYYAIGYVKSIENAFYGNMTLEDADGNTLSIYGTYSFDGKLSGQSILHKFEVGDVVVVYGKMNYYAKNSVSQMKNAKLVQVGNEVCVATDAHKMAVTLLELTIQATASKDFVLPVAGTTYTDVVISWTSNNDAIVISGANAAVTQGSEVVNVTLTASIVAGTTSETKTYAVQVLADAPLAESATIVIAANNLSSAKSGDVTALFTISSPTGLVLGNYLTANVAANGSNGLGFYANYRLYANAVLTFSVADGYVIKSIELKDCQSKESGKTADGSVTGLGNVSLAWSKQNLSHTYTDGIDELVISCSSGQFRFSSIVIVVEKVA